jgi:pyrimidine-nucleoside phosphorylase
MRAVDVIAKKRDGQVLDREEIEFFVKGFTSGEIADYQAAAWAMAAFLRGMSHEETAALALAMAHSGEVLDLSGIPGTVLDKHSSGGVGDKTTIAVAPWVAACGVPVAKMSGRGLAHTGGTIDKLESIPGFNAVLSVDDFIRQVKDIGIVVSAQTHDLAPADGKLYALRDATATVGSIPLIASSIMSKKIAAGAQGIVLDVKLGSGAFMKDEASAVELAELMVQIGQSVGRIVTAVISDMNQPLGNAVGNALELIEAIETLKGGGPGDFEEHCLTVAGEMLMLGQQAKDPADARSKLQVARQEGRAMNKMRAWIQAQGGDVRVVEDYTMLPHARIIADVPAPASGYIERIDALEVGLTAMRLGGGRAKKGDRVDHAVGLVLRHKVGDWIERGEPLLTLHAEDQMIFEEAAARLSKAIAIGVQKPEATPLVHRIIK